MIEEGDRVRVLESGQLGTVGEERRYHFGSTHVVLLDEPDPNSCDEYFEQELEQMFPRLFDPDLTYPGNRDGTS